MARIGVFIDSMGQTVPLFFREKILSILKEIPEINFILEVEDLNSHDCLQRMVKHLEKGDIDRVLIIGGSPKTYESSFQKFGYPTPLNPYLFSIANIREQVLWTLSTEDAIAKAKHVILKSLHMLNYLIPIKSEEIPLKPEVLIIGGGISGISTALALANSGIHVTIIEKEKGLGGCVNDLRIFYQDLKDARKWVEEKISEVSRNQRIDILTQCQLIHLKGHIGRFEAKVRKFDGSEIILSPSIIIVASGFERETEKKGIYAFHKVKTLSELEKWISQENGSVLHCDGKEVQTLTFILDIVNEDIKIDSINAIKQALILQEKFQCQSIILCKDVKVSSDGLERLYRKAREHGVLFFKYEEPPRLSLVNGQLKIDFKDTSVIKKEDQWPVSIISDIIVISEAFKPSKLNGMTSRILGIHLGENGFLMEDNPQLIRVRSNRRGIFIVSGCRFPQTLSEAMIEADAVAQEVISLLEKGTYAYDLSVAEVDPNKCALCYTCPRLCPHAAITIEKYSDKNIYFTPIKGEPLKWWAAKVDPASCYGCGICVSECPAKAIRLQHMPAELIYSQMGFKEIKI